MPDKRLEIIKYKDKEIVYVNAADANRQESLALTEESVDFFDNNQDKGPFLIFGDYTNVNFGTGIVEKLRASINRQGKNFHKFAVIGLNKSTKIIAKVLTVNVPFKFKIFNSKAEALEWLVE